MNRTMTWRPLASWTEVGARVAEARHRAGLSQDALSAQVELERTALAKIESGRRALSSLELARLAAVLERPIEWFVSEPPPAVVSRRGDHILSETVQGFDQELESLSRDVELLLELGTLRPCPRDPMPMPTTLEEAEALAGRVRSDLAAGSGPLTNLVRLVSQLGLHVAVLNLGDEAPDGAYVSLVGAGAALVNGATPSGRRRFTLAHELGHHVLVDEYSSDWTLAQPADTREKLINAFAINLLMPRASVVPAWRARGHDGETRRAAVSLAVEYRLSWTAVCAQLRNLELIDEASHRALVARPASRSELAELGLFIVDEMAPPTMSPDYTAAVLAALRKQKIGASRAVELLHGALNAHELPEADDVPLEALRGELGSPV